MVDDGAIETLITEGAGVDRRGGRAPKHAGDGATTWRRSSTRRAPPVGPKGVELTHGNFVTLAEEAASASTTSAPRPARERCCSCRWRTSSRGSSRCCASRRRRIGHTPDTKNLLADLGTFQPTFVLAVPRVFEKVYNSAEQKAGRRDASSSSSGGPPRPRSCTPAPWTPPRAPTPRLKAQHALADRLVLHKVRNALGGHASYAISGGAPLGERGSATSTAASA